MRGVRLLPLLLVPLVVVVAGCGKDTKALPTDPTNGVAEVDHAIQRDYDRTDWDADALATATDLTQRIAASDVGCDNPGPQSVDDIRTDFQRVQLPMPAAYVNCTSTDGEDLTIEVFHDEQRKEDFIAAKADLICERGRLSGMDASGVSSYDGLAYVDLGTLIIEPDTTPMADKLAQLLDGTSSNMCPGITNGTAASA